MCLKTEKCARRESCGIDMGRQLPAVPVTPPYVRIRIRRFGGLSYWPLAPFSRGMPSEAKYASGRANAKAGEFARRHGP